MFALYMNPVTANAEHFIPVAISDSEERLNQLLADEQIAGFNDGSFFRSYREGPLHNFNPPAVNGCNCFGANEGRVDIMSEDDLLAEYQAKLTMWQSHFSTAARL